MGHIRLSREADLVVVAPATADILAKMAAGLADDLATTALLATDKPVMVAPAMNVMMWAHAGDPRQHRDAGAARRRPVGPGVGDMACGETGIGRMGEPRISWPRSRVSSSRRIRRPRRWKRSAPCAAAGAGHQRPDP